MTSSQSRPLTREEVAAFAAEVDELRNRIVADLGENDARYVRRIRDAVRWSELGGRALLFAGILPPAWALGTLLLGLSKILENMELGHNVMHGQYDWMQDPEFHSQTYDWDNACAAPAWRHSHNYMHHKFTNVVGRDRDVGYGFLRLFPDQPWHPAHLLQPPASLLLALGFQWGVALHDLELERVLRGEKSVEELRKELKPVLRKARRQLLKDYAIFPLLAEMQAETCRNAIDAAREAMHTLDRANRARAEASKPVAEVDLALHIGEVLYGNVGAADRLDFTVIGPAVNEAARIETLCEPLGRKVLVSADFAAIADSCNGLQPLGHHRLRGVREPRAIFGLDV